MDKLEASESLRKQEEQATESQPIVYGKDVGAAEARSLATNAGRMKGLLVPHVASSRLLVYSSLSALL